MATGTVLYDNIKRVCHEDQTITIGYNCIIIPFRHGIMYRHALTLDRVFEVVYYWGFFLDSSRYIIGDRQFISRSIFCNNPGRICSTKVVQSLGTIYHMVLSQGKLQDSKSNPHCFFNIVEAFVFYH